MMILVMFLLICGNFNVIFGRYFDEDLEGELIFNIERNWKEKTQIIYSAPQITINCSTKIVSERQNSLKIRDKGRV